MVSTALAIPALPAHLTQFAAKHAGDNAGASGGIKAGSWPRISIGGSKFSIKANGEVTLITDPTNPDLPKMQLETVVVGHNPMVSKTYYEGDFEEGDKDEPDCSSDDGLTPDAHVAQKMSVACATCPKNAWGSKISKMSGKPIKACSDNKRLVVLRADGLDDDAYEFSVKPASLKDWALYVQELNKRGIPVSAVVTLIYFDPAATYPKCLFKFGRYLTPEELAVVEERKEGEDVQLIASPRRTGPQLPPGTIPIQPAAAAPAPAPAPTTPPPAVAPAPVTPPPPVDPYAGQPAHVKPAVEASGGLGSVGGDAVYKVLTGKDAPTHAAQQVAPPPPPPDPYAGQPVHVEPAVTAAGGLGTPTGDATYKALTGKDAPGAAAPAAAAPAGRKKKTTGATAPTPPVTAAQTPAAIPAAPAAPPAASMVAAPAAQVVPPGGVMDIEAMLAAALKTPVGQ